MITASHAAYVVDASVAVKWFSKKVEPDRAAAFALRDRHAAGRCQLIVPDFFFLEVLSGIRLHAKASEEVLPTQVGMVPERFLSSAVSEVQVDRVGAA